MDNVLILTVIGMVNGILTQLLLAAITSFFLERGVSGVDVNKPDLPRLPEEGGVAITISLLFSIGLYAHLLEYKWAALLISTTGLIALLGFVDRLKNIRPYPRLAYCMIIGSLYSIFYIGSNQANVFEQLLTILCVGILYSIAVNSYNLLAGFNGLEAGLTVISSIALSGYFLWNGFVHEAAICVLITVSYSVFYSVNKFPARVFIGSSGTYVPPSLYFGLCIVSGQWLPFLFVMAPHLVNVAIRFCSGGVTSRSDHTPLVFRDGLLHLPPRSYLSLIRLYLRSGPKHERQIVRYVLALELSICALMILVL